jgi:hypothetical protein
MISIHQVGVMVDSGLYREKVIRYCSDSQKKNRLLGSERILLKSARKIADLQIDVIDRGMTSHIITMTPVILAVIILALNVMKYPNAARNSSDMEVRCRFLPNLSDPLTWTPSSY